MDEKITTGELLEQALEWFKFNYDDYFAERDILLCHFHMQPSPELRICQHYEKDEDKAVCQACRKVKPFDREKIVLIKNLKDEADKYLKDIMVQKFEGVKARAYFRLLSSWRRQKETELYKSRIR
jgi:hypothetical protein